MSLWGSSPRRGRYSTPLPMYWPPYYFEGPNRISVNHPGPPRRGTPSRRDYAEKSDGEETLSGRVANSYRDRGPYSVIKIYGQEPREPPRVHQAGERGVNMYFNPARSRRHRQSESPEPSATSRSDTAKSGERDSRAKASLDTASSLDASEKDEALQLATHKKRQRHRRRKQRKAWRHGRSGSDSATDSANALSGAEEAEALRSAKEKKHERYRKHSQRLQGR